MVVVRVAEEVQVLSDDDDDWGSWKAPKDWMIGEGFGHSGVGNGHDGVWVMIVVIGDVCRKINTR